MNHKFGWLAPDGSFVECGSYEHVSIARDLVKKFYPDDPNYHWDDILLAKGWVHIGISAFDHEYVFWWNKFLTEPQKAFLKPYFEDSDIKICYSAICKWDKEMDGIYR